MLGWERHTVSSNVPLHHTAVHRAPSRRLYRDDRDSTSVYQENKKIHHTSISLYRSRLRRRNNFQAKTRNQRVFGQITRCSPLPVCAVPFFLFLFSHGVLFLLWFVSQSSRLSSQQVNFHARRKNNCKLSTATLDRCAHCHRVVLTFLLWHIYVSRFCNHLFAVKLCELRQIYYYFVPMSTAPCRLTKGQLLSASLTVDSTPTPADAKYDTSSITPDQRETVLYTMIYEYAGQSDLDTPDTFYPLQ